MYDAADKKKSQMTIISAHSIKKVQDSLLLRNINCSIGQITLLCLGIPELFLDMPSNIVFRGPPVKKKTLLGKAT